MEKRESVKKQQQATTSTHELLRHVSRLFHDPKHTVCLDYIIRMRCIADDALAERLHCQLKDVHRILAVLRDDKMIKVESRQEGAGGGSAPVTSSSAQNSKMGTTRMYSFVDLRQAVRAIRWRLEKMREASEARLRADLERKGYKCGQCGKRWSPLDVQSLTVSVDGFQCDNCDLTVVTDDEEDDPKTATTMATVKKRPQELHVQLMDTVAPLVLILKRINIDDLPIVRFTELMKSVNTLQTTKNTDDNTPLKTPAALEIGVTVELDSDPSQGTTKHDLPVWYTHSTVTGEKLVDKQSRDFSPFDSNALDDADKEEPPNKKSRSVEIVFGDFDDIPSPHTQDTDPTILVRGVEKPFSVVTEEDKRMMTSEEYERYFEHYLRIQGQE